MTPLAIVSGIMAMLLLENVQPIKRVVQPYMPVLTRIVVLTMMAMVASGILSGIVALTKNEKPRWLAVAGLFLTVTIIIIFHFVAVGPNGD